MKRIVLLLCLLLAIGWTSASAGILGDDIYVRASGGGKYGYNEKIESHDPGILWDTHKLTCLNPGYIACSWTNPPGRTRTTQAWDLIGAGNLADSMSYVWPNGDVTYTWWVATDAFNVEINERVENAGSLQ